MRLLGTLLCASAVSSAPVPPGLLAKALEVKNWVKAGGVASFLSGLKVFNEEAAAREDERQDEKQNLRDKAKATANYVVWYHLDLEERASGETNRCEFEQMIQAAKPIMKKKLRKRGNFLARLLTSTPSPQLAEIYVREEIVKKMQDKGIKMIDGDTKFEKMDACGKDTNESKWPTIFAGGKVENAEDGDDGKEEAKTTSKKLKRLLGGVVAAVSAVLLFK
jgi:hypothetical protein